MDRRIGEATRNPYIRLLATLAALFFFGWAVYALRAVLTPVLLSFLIAYLLDPLVDRLEARGFKRTPAILFLMLLLFIGTGLMIFLIALAVRDLSEVIKTDLPNWLEQVVLPWLNREVLPWVATTFEIELGGETVRDPFSGIIHELRGELSAFVPRLAGPVRAILSSALSGTLALAAWAANLILIPLFSFYLLRDFDSITLRVKRLLPRRYSEEIISIFRQIDDTIAAFVRGQLMVMLILGVLYGIGLSIARVKLGFGIGLLAGILSVIPYLGSIAGVLMALLMSLVGGDHIWWNLIGTGLTFGVVQALEGTVITPKIVGDKVGLHPVWVILALMVGAQVLGVLGMLLAIPSAAVIRIILKRALARYEASELFRGEEGAGGTLVRDGEHEEPRDDEPGDDGEPRDGEQEEPRDDEPGDDGEPRDGEQEEPRDDEPGDDGEPRDGEQEEPRDDEPGDDGREGPGGDEPNGDGGPEPAEALVGTRRGARGARARSATGPQAERDDESARRSGTAETMPDPPSPARAREPADE